MWVATSPSRFKSHPELGTWEEKEVLAVTTSLRGAPVIKFDSGNPLPDGRPWITSVPLNKTRVLTQAEYEQLRPKVEERKALIDRRGRIDARLNRWYYRTLLEEVADLFSSDTVVEKLLTVFSVKYEYEPGSFLFRDAHPELAERYRVEAERIEAEVDAELAQKGGA